MPHFKIPYEGNEYNLGITAMKNIIQNHPEAQVGYSKRNHQMGYYRTWMESLSTDQIDKFIRHNHDRIEAGLTKNTLLRGPTIAWDLFWRNQLYTLELYYRQNKGPLDALMLKNWQDEVESDRAYWEGKLHVAVGDFYGDTESDETVSEHTPYY
jgi:hypothetical protein